MYSHYSAYSSPLDACHRCSLQHYETTVNLYGINCEFAFPLLRIHCSLHLRFHDQLLVAVCAFINLPSEESIVSKKNIAVFRHGETSGSVRSNI